MATVRQDLAALRGHLANELQHLDGELGEAKEMELKDYLTRKMREKELVIKAIDFALSFFKGKEED